MFYAILSTHVRMSTFCSSDFAKNLQRYTRHGMEGPKRPQEARDFGPVEGMAAAIAPQGTIGCLFGMFMLLLGAIAVGLAHGPGLVAAIIAMVVLVPLIRLALKREMRCDDAAAGFGPNAESSLPDDAELSDEERRDAMRKYDEEHSD
jgi:hypothetical protein